MTRGLPEHYAILGVAEDATPSAIRQARRRLLRRHHPDVATSSKAAAEEATRRILLAGEVLLDPVSRAEYDAHLKASRRRTGPVASTSAKVMRDLTCSACGHLNLRTTRDWCLYCGEGIGETPQRMPRRPLAREVRTRNRHWNLACGAVVGLFLGAVLAFATGAFSPGMAFMTITLPMLVLAFVGSAFGDRIFGVSAPRRRR